jgi:UDP-N-acetyl-D-galactosamine dehydrogenase
VKDFDSIKVGIVGLGYVGLPLAVEFGKKIQTIGFDINTSRIAELEAGKDRTQETSPEELQAANKLSFTKNKEDIKALDVYIVTVPTPVDEDKRPDLTPIEKASELVGSLMIKGSIVIYESTVFPGCTDEVCVPILESISGLQHNLDFFTGYSPERINPGDKENRLPNIVKITSGSTEAVAKYVDDLYRLIITAGTYRAASIQVAEAAKVIENVQRDVNIALMNELAMIFKRLNIDTHDVLDAAGSKWNFLPFKPGLVGGHCIGVDPYYLYAKSERVGYKPKIISAAREINESVGEIISNEIMAMMTQERIHIVDSNILVLGLSFKENCPDLRNTRVVDIIERLKKCNANIDVYDPWVDEKEAMHFYDIKLTKELKSGYYDAVILAVAHSEFIEMSAESIKGLAKKQSIIYDVKSILDRSIVDGRL